MPTLKCLHEDGFNMKNPYIAFLAILLLSTSFLSSCAPGPKRPGQKLNQEKGEIPEPESKDGCLAFEGKFVPTEDQVLESLVFEPQTENLKLKVEMDGSTYEILTGKDEEVLSDGTTVVASCNGKIVSASVKTWTEDVYLKISKTSDTEVSVSELDDLGNESKTWTAQKANP